MKKVEVFETVDGFLTKDKKEAEKRDRETKIKNFANEFADRFAWSGMSRTDVGDMLAENIEDFIEGYKKANGRFA